jgi:LAO/AO transport system kinase
VAELVAAVEAHHAQLLASGALDRRRRDRARTEIMAILEDRLRRQAHERTTDLLPTWTRRVAAGEATPYTAARALLAALLEQNT